MIKRFLSWLDYQHEFWQIFIVLTLVVVVCAALGGLILLTAVLSAPFTFWAIPVYMVDLFVALLLVSAFFYYLFEQV